jgi:hypothetical protein
MKKIAFLGGFAHRCSWALTRVGDFWSSAWR